MKLLGQVTWVLGMLGSVVAGCAAGANDESLYVMNYHQELDEDGAPIGNELALGCSIAVYEHGASGSTTGGGIGPDIAYHSFTEGSGLHVEISSGDTMLEERLYDEAFIRSGEVDLFEVITPGEKQFRFAHWGADSCDSLTPPD